MYFIICCSTKAVLLCLLSFKEFLYHSLTKVAKRRIAYIMDKCSRTNNSDKRGHKIISLFWVRVILLEFS